MQSCSIPLITGLVLLAGCSWHPALTSWPGSRLTSPMAQPALANPLLVPMSNRDLIWDQLVDTLDNYFVISREERVRAVGDVLTPGWIETRPLIGSTHLEPWRHDSTPGFERLHATLQTVRRTAHVDMTPASGGYLVQIIVSKELEDVDRPEQTTVGGATRRHDGSIVRIQAPPVSGPVPRGWIAQGRDVALEQRLLWEIRDRLRDDGWEDETIPPPGEKSGFFAKDQL